MVENAVSRGAAQLVAVRVGGCGQAGREREICEGQRTNSKCSHTHKPSAGQDYCYERQHRSGTRHAKQTAGRALTLDEVLLGVFGAARPVGALAQHCRAGRASRGQCSPVSKLGCILLLSMRPRQACGTHHTMPAHHSTDIDTLHPAAPPLTWILHLCFLILIQPHLLAQSLALPAITGRAAVTH